MPAPKRVGPQAVPPLIIDSIRLEAVNAGRKRGLPQNGGYVEAFDLQSGKALWLLQVYAIQYSQEIEEDVQDRFITALEWDAANKSVIVHAEFARRFAFDLQTRLVRALP